MATADRLPVSLLFFFNDTATTEIYTLSLHDALPISRGFSTSAATSAAAASGAGAGSGSGSSANISLIFCSTVGSSVMTPSRRGLVAQHLREEPGKQRVPRAQVRRQDRQDGHDNDGGCHQLRPARPVHPL